ncbi:unnamed protein product [Pieris brassicae]|uniref:UMA domain-containing protein n=1 Tax=Pieris brassicae TaxID=7116 RepID=A0A9P0X9S0_PIEBR|nr:unnamed protein product [Pieris brassicae]
MFTALFGKRRSSPVEDNPPIPGPKPDDGFVVVDPAVTGGLYPNIGGSTYPQRRAPPVPEPPHKQSICDPTFHYLQGVPFSLARELQLSANQDSIAMQMGDLLAFLSHKVNIDSYSYTFTVEKSVLKEC